MRPAKLLACAIAAVASLAAASPSLAATLTASPLGGAFTKPDFVTAPPGDTHRLLVGEQAGKVWLILDGVRQAQPFLTVPLQPNEQLVLYSLAFAPDYATSGRFYTYVMRQDKLPGGGVANIQGRLDEFRRSASDPNSADASTKRTVLTTDNMPTGLHPGGGLAFGPDGYLYLSVGDGGPQGDTDNSAQRLDTLQGKLLRLDPAATGAGAPYSVPIDNPWAGSGSPTDVIYARGFRNPWRFAFGPSGGFFVGDPGEQQFEEIDYATPSALGGANFGWNCFEGNAVYDASNTCPGAVAPVLTYADSGPSTCRAAVIGGLVVQDSALGDFVNRYVYGDYCSGAVRSFLLCGGQATGDASAGLTLPNLTSFGTDAQGAVYAVTDPGTTGGGSLYKLGSNSTAGPSTCGGYSSVVLGGAGLLGYWRLGEASGTTAVDQVAGRNGRYVGGAALGQAGALAGDPDTAAGFDGGNDELTLGDPALAGAMTIEGWFDWRGGRMLMRDNTVSGGWILAFDENTGSLKYRVGGTTFVTSRAAASVKGGWHYYALTVSGSSTAFYIDGQLVHSGSGAGAARPALPWHVMRNGQNALYTQGRADELAIYDRALSASTIQAHYNAATAAPPPDPVIAAAGDVACDPASTAFNGGAGSASQCAQQRTSDLMVGRPLAWVLPLGDEQYSVGSLSQFQGSFDPSWGRLKSIIRPTTGNHEYATPGAAGYFTYFNGSGAAGGPAGAPNQGYYSFDVGSWHLIALNSNCVEVGGCDAGSPQEQWLRSDLAAHPSRCTLAYWHHPRFSSGLHGDNPSVAGLWQALHAAGADVVLSGHDHDYERFAPVDAAGAPDATAGLREFVVGTGGESHYPFGTPSANSQVRDASTFGVLELTLHPSSYDWSFRPESGGTFTDSGSAACH